MLMVLMVNIMEITTNKPLNKNTLNIIKNGFEEQKKVTVLSLYEDNNDVYGIYINPLSQLLSFVEQPLYSMSTDIDGHNIFMMELGSLLHLIYHNASMQMYQWLCHPSDLIIPNDSNYSGWRIAFGFEGIILVVCAVIILFFNKKYRHSLF